MPIRQTHLSALCFAGILACALPALAQNLDEELNDLVRAKEAIAEAEPETQVIHQTDNQYRIGIDCSELSPALASHLRLQEGSGLLVNRVLETSPAGRAGIKRHDVLIEANGHPLTTVPDLVAAVNKAKGSELNLSVIHAGEEKLIKLTPEERDEEEVVRLRNGFANKLGQGFAPGINNQVHAEMERAIAQMQKQFGQLGPMNQGWRRLNPGVMIDFGFDPTNPSAQRKGFTQSRSSYSRSMTMANGEQLTVDVDRNGDEPAKIKVKRGSKTWDLTESDLDKLPADIRPLVESQLNGGGGFQALMAPRMPQMPNRPLLHRPAVPQPKDEKVQERFNGLELQMKELKDAIESIQGNK